MIVDFVILAIHGLTLQALDRQSLEPKLFFLLFRNIRSRRRALKCGNMNMKNTYRNLIDLVLIAIVPVFLLSCERIKDNMDDCGIYLEFVYDYNMEYKDFFDPHVSTVDVFVFDEGGKYLFTKHARREELTRGNRMFLGGDLHFGKYKILTVGGLTDHFRVSDHNGNVLSPGQTMLDEVRIALERTTGVVSHEFSPLWVGKTIEVDYKADLSVWSVNLVKNTNRFNVSLVETEQNAGGRAGTPVYTFDVETPEGAVYGHDNSPRLKEKVTYAPYDLVAGDEPGELSEGRLNTNRLMYGDDYDYKLVVRDVPGGNSLWEYDLMELLEEIKNGLYPGSTLSMQEFLDRQSEWDLKIRYKDKGGFVAIAIEINGWIIWLNDIGV